MLGEIKHVLRLVMCLRKPRQHGLKDTGGLLVLLWTECGSSFQSVNCTVAAAGIWCAGTDMKELQSVLKESKFPLVCPQPDTEELSVFSGLYGPLRCLLTFTVRDLSNVGRELFSRIEQFLHTFSLANAEIKIHLKLKILHQIIHREFRVNMSKRVSMVDQSSVKLDVTSHTQFPQCVKKGRWCWGGHPVRGVEILLSIPPETMYQGLFGDLSVQLVTLLGPCVLQYPHLPTRLSHIQVLVYSPCNVPITGCSAFFQSLPAHLDFKDLGLQGLTCSSSKDLAHGGGLVYDVKQENSEDQEKESNLPPVQQNLMLFLFLQHSDPFTCQLSDIMATEALIEHHLEEILSNNRRAVTAALQTELKKSLKDQNHRKKKQEILLTAAKVILTSATRIVSCSSNMEFRKACLNCMKVCDTRELSASLSESLRTLCTSWKFIPRAGCYSKQGKKIWRKKSQQDQRSEVVCVFP